MTDEGYIDGTNYFREPMSPPPLPPFHPSPISNSNIDISKEYLDVLRQHEKTKNILILLFLGILIVIAFTFMFVAVKGAFKSETNQELYVTPSYNITLNNTDYSYIDNDIKPEINLYLNQTTVIEKVYVNGSC